MKLVLTALLLTLLSLASLKDAQAEGYVSLGGHRLMSRISFEESAYTLNWVFREKRLKYGWTLLGIETSKFTRTYGKTTDVTDYTGGAYSSYRFNKSLYLDSGVQFSTGKFLPQYRVTFLPTFVHDNIEYMGKGEYRHYRDQTTETLGLGLGINFGDGFRALIRGDHTFANRDIDSGFGCLQRVLPGFFSRTNVCFAGGKTLLDSVTIDQFTSASIAQTFKFDSTWSATLGYEHYMGRIQKYDQLSLEVVWRY